LSGVRCSRDQAARLAGWPAVSLGFPMPGTCLVHVKSLVVVEPCPHEADVAAIELHLKPLDEEQRATRVPLILETSFFVVDRVGLVPTHFSTVQ
jgi:hypothetical protein